MIRWSRLSLMDWMILFWLFIMLYWLGVGNFVDSVIGNPIYNDYDCVSKPPIICETCMGDEELLAEYDKQMMDLEILDVKLDECNYEFVLVTEKYDKLKDNPWNMWWIVPVVILLVTLAWILTRDEEASEKKKEKKKVEKQKKEGGWHK